MRFTTAFIALATPFLVSAAPVKRQASDNTVLVLKFADVLEQLESEFYDQALNKFKSGDFEQAGFASSQLPLQQFEVIQSDEVAHSTAIRSVLKSLGKDPVDTCKFDFGGALSDVATMAATARVVENVGVGAYLGGATLIDDVVILDAAASILTIEARHQTVLNILNGASAVPQAFDIPLTPSEVLALAGPFISGCDLGIPANTPLSITNTGTIGPGTRLEFSATSIDGTVSEDTLFCQMMLGGASTSLPLPFKDCVVPDDIDGPVAIWITRDNQPLINNVRDRATTQQVAGPAMAFIDTKFEELGQLARSGKGSHRKGGKGKGEGKGKGKDFKGKDSDDFDFDGKDFDFDGSDDNNDDQVAEAQAQPGTETSSTTVISLDQASAVVAAASSTVTVEPTLAAAAAAPAPPPPQASGSAQSLSASTPGGPNMQTGKSADGAITVIGWSNIPAPGTAPAAAPAAPASGGSSGGYSYGGY